MVRSCDFDVHNFLREMDQSLEASRNVFRDFDARFQQISEDDWEVIQLKVSHTCPVNVKCFEKRRVWTFRGSVQANG